MLFPKKFKKEKIKINDIKINCSHGGEGKALLLIHGYPQNNTMWHKIVKKLSKSYYIVCPDLRGYGKSSKPKGDKTHNNYSKRTMAKDMANLMSYLGFHSFYVAGHDRGARVAHRLCLDFKSRVLKACFMDIAPTYHMFKNTNQAFATGYYHWFFLIQPDNLPENLISKDPAYYLKQKLKRWSAQDVKFNRKFDKKAVNDYIKCFDKPSIHGSCEDYRAAATIDLVHDKEDRKRKINMPVLILWGKKGFINKTYNVKDVWQKYATHIEAKALNCGHFLPEEKPKEVLKELKSFF